MCGLAFFLCAPAYNNNMYHVKMAAAAISGMWMGMPQIFFCISDSELLVVWRIIKLLHGGMHVAGLHGPGM